MNEFQVGWLTPIPAVAAKPLRIAACLTDITCRIVDTLEMGDQAVGKSAGDAQRAVSRTGTGSAVSEAQTVVLRREEFDAVVFDMGGVVTKTAAVHAAAWKRLFDDYMGERSRSIFDRVPYVALLPRSL